jgi:aldose 1-epimerase
MFLQKLSSETNSFKQERNVTNSAFLFLLRKLSIDHGGNEMRVTQRDFGEWNGEKVTAYTLVNKNGMSMTALDYGCTITEIITPDRNGALENVVLGFDSLEEYQQHLYFGAVIGRHAGRIKNAEFELDGVTYRLAKNDNGNNLHGGVLGFDKVVWKTRVKEVEDAVGLEFSYLSPDGEDGFPGNVEMKVTYTLTNQNEMLISYEGKSDKRTIINVTNHAYFNLSGNLKRDILDHTLTIKGSQFLELNEELLPTGEILPVAGTPFDFTQGRQIKAGIDSGYTQNTIAGNGYDHPFLLNEHHNKEIVLQDNVSGRVLVIETDEPGVVLYTGNQITNDFHFRGIPSKKYLGLCLETQGMPDSIHYPQFPSSILEKDEIFKSKTKYKFSVI